MEDEYQMRETFKEKEIKVMLLYADEIKKLEVSEDGVEEKDELRRLLRLRDVVEEELGKFEKDGRRRL